MNRIQRVGAFRSIAAILIVAVGTCGADAALFKGPTSYVDLPGFQPTEITKSVVIANGVGSAASSLKLELLPPDAPMKGTIDRYEIVADAATNGWRIELVTKLKTRKPIGKLTLQGDALAFQWETGVTRPDGAQLRNCVLSIEGPQTQAVALRAPIRQSSLVLDFTKEINRIPLVDDLPDETFLRLAVTGIEGAPVSGELSSPEAKLKEAVFVGLKRADADVPGARVRAILWKTSLKPEVIVRPELVPVAPSAGSTATTNFPPAGVPRAVPGSTLPRTATPRPPVAAGVGEDPTKPNSVNLPFTIRSLATAKTMLNKQLTGAQQQIVIDQNLIFAKQRELSKYQGTIVGTPEEIDLILAKIQRLQNEISALSREVTQLEQVVVPNLQKQVAAFPPLEQLGNSLHQKASLGLKVYYTVAGQPVDVLVLEGAPAEKK